MVEDFEVFYDSLKERLVEAKEFGFLTNVPTPAVKLDPEKNVLYATVASDGMTLDQKIALEKELHTNFREYFQSVEFELQVVFKRARKVAAKAPGSNAHATASLNDPSPFAAQKRSPFGLNIQKRAVPGVRSVVCVASGKGGVGKSTVSVNLAVGLAESGLKVGILDADVYGPSVPLLLGFPEKTSLKVDEFERLLPPKAHGVTCMSFGFLSSADSPVIWRGPLVGKAIEQFLYEVDWGDLDILIIDLPPGTGDVQLSLIESVPIAGAAVVSTGQQISLLDAHKAVSMFRKLDVPVFGIVENMSTFKCGECSADHKMFGDEFDQFCDGNQLRKLASIPILPSVFTSSAIPVSKVDPTYATSIQPLVQAVKEEVSWS